MYFADSRREINCDAGVGVPEMRGGLIRPYDNIPVLSYLILGGKCRGCKTKISPMYPLVEFLTGVLFFACYYAFGISLETLKWATFSAIMIVLVFTDMRERILPDVVNYSGFGLGLVLSLFVRPERRDRGVDLQSPFSVPSSDAGAVFGGCAGGRGGGQRVAVAGVRSVFQIAWARRHGSGRRENDVDGRRVSGREAHAIDDLAGSVLGSIIGIAVILARRKEADYELPFGTFLGRGRVAGGVFRDAAGRLVSVTVDDALTLHPVKFFG